MKRRHILTATLIQGIREFYELHEVTSAFDLPYSILCHLNEPPLETTIAISASYSLQI
jgi:hypothetical protein